MVRVRAAHTIQSFNALAQDVSRAYLTSGRIRMPMLDAAICQQLIAATSLYILPLTRWTEVEIDNYSQIE